MHEFGGTRRNVVRSLALILAAGAVLASARADASLGDCGQPVTNGSNPTATDCLYILKAAVGAQVCTPECVCDVNAAGGVTATDALTCLKKAVGQNVTLDCGPGCVGSTTTLPPTTTTTTTLPQGQSAELVVFTKSSGSYALADLAGTWDVNTLATGPGAPYWSRGSLTVQPDGDFSGSISDIDGANENVSGTLAISGKGIVTCTSLQCPVQFQGGMDAGKSVMAITFTWDDGTTELLIGTKRGGSYAQADLAGTWGVHDLLSNPGEASWERGVFNIGTDGAASGNLTGSDGSSDSVSATIKLSSRGALTCTSGCYPTMKGALDGAKRVAAFTFTGDLGAANLMLMCSQGASYAQADLAGAWRVNALVSGDDAPLWKRGGITIQSNGDFSGTLTRSSGGSEDASGTFALNSKGIVTIGDDRDFHCALDALKTVFVCTNSD